MCLETWDRVVRQVPHRAALAFAAPRWHPLLHRTARVAEPVPGAPGSSAPQVDLPIPRCQCAVDSMVASRARLSLRVWAPKVPLVLVLVLRP